MGKSERMIKIHIEVRWTDHLEVKWPHRIEVSGILRKDEKYYDPAKLSKHIVTWDMQKLAEDFDFKKHFSSIK